MFGLGRPALFGLVCLLGLVTGIAPSSAGDYPNRPVHWLVGFAAGGPVDLVARIMSQWLSERLGQQFIVQCHRGAHSRLLSIECSII